MSKHQADTPSATMTNPVQCPFCEIATHDAAERIVMENDRAFLITDGFPVSEGHSLIIPRRHVASFFDTTRAEKKDLMTLLEEAKKKLDQELNPAAHNIGINDGPAAGQTIFHCHIHLIPRYDYQHRDPRGGVRWVNPDKADYWSDR